jgi:phage-related baseplate assembly protein
MELAPAEFFDTDAEAIISELKSDYEGLTGTQLSPGQPEMLLINAIAYRFHLKLIQGNEAARQNLLAYARYPMIDHLGVLQGVTRLPATAAQCELRFSLINGHGAFVLPSSIRVQSVDGKAVFITQEEKAVQVSDTTVTVAAECTVVGKVGNNYPAGDVSIILDPQAYVASAENLATTAGGADQESDDELRERIRLAPSGFSCAGPRDAYRYFAKSAHPAIIDVGVNNPVPGQVNIYPLLDNAQTPSQEIIDAVYAKVNDDKVRPLCDTVIVEAPEKVEYEIEVNVTPLDGSIISVTKKQIEDNLLAYTVDRKNRLGANAVITDIIAESRIRGSVYTVEVVSPEEDVEVDFSQIAFCTNIQVTMLTPVNE